MSTRASISPIACSKRWRTEFVSRAVDRPISARLLASEIGCELSGDGEKIIRGVANLESATDTDLSFFADIRYRERAGQSKAGFLITRVDTEIASGAVRLFHAMPHVAFAKALDALFPALEPAYAISKYASVDETATVKGVEIGANATVGAHSTIGARSVIHANVSIGPKVRIGTDCIIYPGVSIYDHCVIGDRAIIHSGAVIGADGFGFQPSKEGWLKVKQVGAVVIGSDVEIGANTTIDRGAIEDTVIGNGVKIDNLVQIAHNCRIGNHTVVAGCAGMAGSTVIGERCMIGGASMIVGHLSICDDAVISGGTLIAESITEKGRMTGIFPATSHRDWMKIAAQLRRSVRTKQE
jgi:UDP-3-O-[3-hydroxymyristoyl] glucosamine N-acyltransferase